MSYRLKMTEEADYLYVLATGTRTLDTIMAMAVEVLAACDDRGYSRVLLDVQEMTGKLKPFDAYELGTKDLKKLRRPGQMRLSVVDLADNHSRFRFLETVLHNQGFNISIFSNADKAMRWLCEDEISD